MANKILPVFTHIPKTAGTTLQRIVSWQYLFKSGLPYTVTAGVFDPEAVKPFIAHFKGLSASAKQGISIVKGHFPYGIHEYYEGQVKYFTMLRLPQKRLISHLKYLLKLYKYHPQYRKMGLEGLTLKEFMERGLSVNVDNCQVRYLCGVQDIPFGGVNEEYLRMAIDNLQKQYAVVGVTERFDESILLFAKEMGWTAPYYIESNVSDMKTEALQIDEETQALISYYNRYDEQLYKAAMELFDKQVAGAGPGFKEEVATFKAENEKRRSNTLLRIHLASKLRYLNKYHLWALKNEWMRYLKR